MSTTLPARPAPWAFAAPWGAALRQAAARNPRWQPVMLPGVGHTPQLEVPDTVIGTLRDWLGQHFAS